MPKKRFTEEQIGFALRQAEAGTSVGEICRGMNDVCPMDFLPDNLFAGRPAVRSAAPHPD